MVAWTDLGRAAYGPVWQLQRLLVSALKAGNGPDRLLLVEHEPVLTLGRRTNPTHILAEAGELAARGYEVFPVERGGDVTYHGPGQLVAYPILDLGRHTKDLRWYVETLLTSLADTARSLGVAAFPRGGAETGLWVELPEGGYGKLASLGVRVESWVTYHGIALNVDTDLKAFDLIVPCGLPGVRMVSLASLLGRPVGLSTVQAVFLDAFADHFGVPLVEDRAVELTSRALVELSGAVLPVEQENAGGPGAADRTLAEVAANGGGLP